MSQSVVFRRKEGYVKVMIRHKMYETNELKIIMFDQSEKCKTPMYRIIAPQQWTFGGANPLPSVH